MDDADANTTTSAAAPPQAPAVEGGLELDFSRPRLLVVLGACASGKSYAVRALCKELFAQGHFKFARVYSKTARINGEYNWLPDEAIHDISIRGLSEYQDGLLKWRERNDNKEVPQNLLVIDDSYGTIRNPYAPELISWYATHRHSSTTLITLIQFATGIPTTLRGICDYALVFGDKFQRSRRAIYNFVGQWYDREADFLAMFDEATSEEHRCLVFTNGTPTIEGAYQSWKAPPDIDSPPWKVKFKPV